MTRENEISEFLTNAGWGNAVRRSLAGDASARRYERLSGPKGRAVLMDAPPEPSEVANGRAAGYSAVAHLAVDCRPFVALARKLRALGLSAPEIYAENVDRGLLLLEDFGDALFVSLLEEKTPNATPEKDLYAAAVDLLVSLHSADFSDDARTRDSAFEIAPYDAAALKIESDLVIDWYLPGITGVTETPDDVREIYQNSWHSLFPMMEDPSPVLCLRDFHAGNLIWLPHREGPARIGLLDFQDAVIGARSYDLVSLLQDARRDIGSDLETQMLARYIQRASEIDPSFNEDDFRARYALLGAQRSSKIIGIFMRLWLRDGKKVYLPHLPRVWRYLERNLTHPSLNSLKAWFDENVPRKVRVTVPDPDEVAQNMPAQKVGTAG